MKQWNFKHPPKKRLYKFIGWTITIINYTARIPFIK